MANGGFRIAGDQSNNIAEVDANNQLHVRTSATASQSGFTRICSENDPGVITGTPQVPSPKTSPDRRLRVGSDTILFQAHFNQAAQDTARWHFNATTMVMALTSGRLRTNNTSITTLNTGLRLRTRQRFPIYNQKTPLYVSFSLAFTAAMATNTTIEIGLFDDSAANPYTPTDGVFLRANASGIVGVLNYDTAEVTTSALPSPSDAAASWSLGVNTVYDVLIVVYDRAAEFWANGVLLAELAVPASVGQPFRSTSLPLAIKHSIGGTAAGSAFSVDVFDVAVFLGDVSTNKPWGVQRSLAGDGLQIQPGAAVSGGLTTYANGAAPGAVTLTASTQPATNTLGGIFVLPNTITVGESDYPLFAWLNPATTTAVQGKNFVCTGIRVGEAFPAGGTAITGGPLMLTYGIGWGATASSLATAESASFASPGTKAPRREVLGTQTLVQNADPRVDRLGIPDGFQVDFGSSPKVVYPGEYLHIILRITGTDQTAGANVRGSVTVMGYFE